jgi:hypothetical protein
MSIRGRDLFHVRGRSVRYWVVRTLSICLAILAAFATLERARAEESEIKNHASPPQSARQKEIIYEGLVSYGNYRVFGGAENVKLYAAGVEFNRELWPHLFHTRVDAAFEVLPVVLLTQPRRADIWGDPLSKRRTLVPGVGVTPLGVRLLWRDGKRIMPFFEVKGSVIGFTQKALSPQATYENWSFNLTDGVKVRLRGRYDLRLGIASDLHFSNAFVVRSNPAVDLMNLNVGLVYHLRSSRKSY